LIVPSTIAFPKPNLSHNSELPFIRRNSNNRIQIHKSPAFLIGSEINPIESHVQDRYFLNDRVFSDNVSADDLRAVYAYLFDTLHMDPSHHPILITQPIMTHRNLKNILFEIIFETFDAPAAYVEKSPLLSAYFYGSLNGLVVDIGNSSAQIVPIYEGCILEHASKRLRHLGGSRLTQEVGKWLQYPTYTSVLARTIENNFRGYYADRGKNFFVRLPQAVQTVGISESHRNLPYYNTFISRDIKERLSVCLLDFKTLATDADFQNTTQFSALDGTNITMSSKLMGSLMGEAMFDPQLIFQDADDSICSLQGGIYQVIKDCPIDSRNTLLENIYLSGGATMVPGFQKRLHKEMVNLIPRQQKIINVKADEFREHAVWKGGNTLSLNDQFQDMWLLKEEYLENGSW